MPSPPLFERVYACNLAHIKCWIYWVNDNAYVCVQTVWIGMPALSYTSLGFKSKISRKGQEWVPTFVLYAHFDIVYIGYTEQPTVLCTPLGVSNQNIKEGIRVNAYVCFMLHVCSFCWLLLYIISSCMWVGEYCRFNWYCCAFNEYDSHAFSMLLLRLGGRLALR